jgi:hypothetical protein
MGGQVPHRPRCISGEPDTADRDRDRPPRPTRAVPAAGAASLRSSTPIKSAAPSHSPRRRPTATSTLLSNGTHTMIIVLPVPTALEQPGSSQDRSGETDRPESVPHRGSGRVGRQPVRRRHRHRGRILRPLTWPGRRGAERYRPASGSVIRSRWCARAAAGPGGNLRPTGSLAGRAPTSTSTSTPTRRRSRASPMTALFDPRRERRHGTRRRFAVTGRVSIERQPSVSIERQPSACRPHGRARFPHADRSRGHRQGSTAADKVIPTGRVRPTNGRSTPTVGAGRLERWST